jgi:hypothetical protein
VPRRWCFVFHSWTKTAKDGQSGYFLQEMENENQTFHSICFFFIFWHNQKNCGSKMIIFQFLCAWQQLVCICVDKVIGFDGLTLFSRCSRIFLANVKNASSIFTFILQETSKNGMSKLSAI